MFRIEMFCGDKQLAPVMKSLSQLKVVMREAPQFVAGAEFTNGKVKSTGTGTGIEAVRKGLPRKGSKFSYLLVKQILNKAGFANGASQILARLTKAKAIRRRGRGTYEVL